MFRKFWRVGLLIALVLSASFTGLFTGSVAAANNGVPISDGATGPFNRPSVGVSPDNTKVCVVWSKFTANPSDTQPNRTYVRIFDNGTQTWQPATPYDVTKGSNSDTQGGSPRCAIDTAGRTHVVWAEGSPSKYLRYTSLAAGADPGVAANWSGPTTISAEFDSQSPDIAALVADTNGAVWLAYVANIGGSFDILVRNWTIATGWSGAQTAANPGNPTAHYPHIAVDDAGYVHVIFWQGSGGGLRYTYRDKDTGEFTASIQLPGAGGAIQTGGIAVDRTSGDVHAVYVTNIAGGDNNRVVNYVKKTGPTGTTFSAAVSLTGAGNYNNAHIGNSTAGRLIVVANKRSASPEQVVYMVSENAGASWGAETAMTDSAVKAYDPSLAVSDSGTGYVPYWNKNGNKIHFSILFQQQTPRCGTFADVAESDPACTAILALTTAGVIKGYNTVPATFGPNDPVQRAQMAAFMVRSLGWSTMTTGPKTFSDLNLVDGELRNASLILANACTPTGGTVCVAKGYKNGKFGPLDQVTYAQVMSFISRAYVFDQTWTQQGAGYPGAPADHDADINTYAINTANLGPIPGAGTFDWNAPAPRAWVALVLYNAYQTIPAPPAP